MKMMDNRILLITIILGISLVNGQEYNATLGTNPDNDYTIPDADTSENDDCSATTSYVAITNPIKKTLLSAEALFTPYVYSLESTEVVILDDSNNNGCLDSINSTLTNTIVSNKIVFVWRGGNCTEHSKVATLENNGAIAVLIGNTEDSSSVETITDDDTVYMETTIPARMITKTDGSYIEDYINGGSVNGTLMIEFGCYNDSSYPSVICVEDVSGNYWYLDGNFEQQGSDILTYNDHPVYIKEEYYGIVSDLYMYLDDNNGDSDWRWIISWELGLTLDSASDKSDIEAYCANTSIANPNDCEYWLTNDGSNANEFDINPYLSVSDSLCAVGESYVCIESSNYSAGGILGTYKLISPGVGLWSRVTTDSDSTPGYLIYDLDYGSNCDDSSDDNNGGGGNGGGGGSGGGGGGGGRGLLQQWGGCYEYLFKLYDSVDYEAMAYCSLGTSTSSSAYDEYEFTPWLCEEWYVVEDNTISTDEYHFDSSFVVSNGTCDDFTSDTSMDTTDDVDDVSDVICLEDHVLLHSFLEGSYEILDGVRTPSGRHVWYLPDNEDTNYPAYLYYYGDYSSYSSEKWWVISPYNPINNTDYRYAYCAADVSDPIDCAGCWYFYYSGEYDADCEVELSGGYCETTTTLEPILNSSNVDEYYPQFLCMEFSQSYTYTDEYSGTYQRSDLNSEYAAYSDGRYYWIQIINTDGDCVDAENGDTVYYIYYDSLFKYWIWSDTLGDDGDDAWMFCYESNLLDPSDCDVWYYGSGTGYESTVSVDVYDTQCDDYTIHDCDDNGNSASSLTSSDDGTTVAWVLIIILLCICILIALCYYRKLYLRNKMGGADVSFRENKQGNVGHHNGKSRHVVQQSDAIEMGDGLVHGSGNETGAATKGGYNMETLVQDDMGEDSIAQPENNNNNSQVTKGHDRHKSDMIELGDGALNETGTN